MNNALTKSFLSAVVSLGLLGIHASGCGGSSAADCASECSSAQSQSCTIIQGDCSKACAAADTVTTEAQCPDDLDAYITCLDNGTVCTGDSRCGNQQSKFVSCAEDYCTNHPTESACITLAQAIGE